MLWLSVPVYEKVLDRLQKACGTLKLYIKICVPEDMCIFLGSEPYMSQIGIEFCKSTKGWKLLYESGPRKMCNNGGPWILAIVVPKLSCQHCPLPFYLEFIWTFGVIHSFSLYIYIYLYLYIPSFKPTKSLTDLFENTHALFQYVGTLI